MHTQSSWSDDPLLIGIGFFFYAFKFFKNMRLNLKFWKNMRVSNMRVVDFSKIYAFFPTFFETLKIIGFYVMRVVSKICVLGYAFYKRIN